MATVAELNVAITADASGLQQGLGQAERSMTDTLRKVGSSLTGLGVGLSAAITAPLALMAKGAIEAGSSFESAFAGVRKTVDATEPELAALRDSFRRLALEIPVAANELANIAEAAGALGVRKQDILAFTRTMADLGVTTNLTSDQAATGLAQLANIIKNDAGPQFDRLGSTLVALGNAGASTEAQILEMSLRIAGAGKIAGLSEADILGFANALASVGIEAEAGGSAISRVFTKIDDAVKMGGKELKLFAQVAGQSMADFRKSFQEDGAGATIKFIEGLGKITAAGKSLTPVLTELELGDLRVADALKRAAGAGDLLRESVALANRAWKDNTALTIEAAKRYETFESQVQLVLNQLKDLGITLFNNVRPALLTVIEYVKSAVQWFGSLSPTTQNLIVGFGLLAAAVGPVLLAFGGLAKSIVAMSELMTLLQATRIPALIGAFGGLGAAAGLAAVAVTGAIIAAEMKWAQAQARFKRGLEGSAQDVDMWGNKIKKMMRFDDPDLEKFAKAPSKLIGGMVINLKTGARDLEEESKRAGLAIPNGLTSGLKSGGGKAIKAVDQFAEEVKEAMRGITQAIKDGLLGGDEVGRVLASKITPVIDVLKIKTAELATTVRAVGDAFVNEFGRAIDVVTPKIIRGDGSLEALINRMMDLKRVAETAARATKEEFDALSDVFKDLGSELPSAWNKVLDGIIQGSGKTGTELLKFGVKVKGYAADIIHVFDTMPGKWGQSLNRALDEVNKWINFIDAAIKLIQRILGDAQTGLTGVFDSLSASMKKSTQAMEDTAKSSQDASQDWAGAMEKMSKSSEDSEEKTVNAFSVMSSAISGFVSGLGIAAATGSKAIGALGGAAMGAMQGFMVAGPWGALAGGIGGLLGGLFGGGKSEAQKKAEREAAENAKMNMQQTAQNIINSALEGFNKGLEFLNKLDEFTAPRKEKFKAFFKSFTKLLDYFVELSKSWSTTSMAQVKAAGEAIGPIAEAISALPAVFDAINGHFGVAQSAIDQFFNDFDRVVTGFFTKVEAWAVGRAKHARKIATNIAPAIDLLGPLLEAIKNMSSLSRPPDEAFDIIESVLETIVMRTAALSEKFDKALLKVMQNFADKSGGALSLWSEAVGSIKAMVDLKMPTEQDFANVFTGIEKIISGMTDIASRLTTEGLGRAEGMAQASLTLFASLKAGVEALSALKDFAGVLPEVFDKFFDDFNHAIDLVESMANRAITFDNASKMFKDYISSGATHLATAFRMLAEIMNSAGSFFPSGSPVSTTSVPAMASGGTIQSSGLAYLHAGERVVPASVVSGSQGSAGAAPTQIHVHVHANTIVNDAGFVDLIIKGISQAEKMGRVSKGLLGGGSLQFAR